MGYEFLLTEKLDNGIAIATLNRPDRNNTLHYPLFLEIHDLMEEMNVDQENFIKELVENSKKINSKAISLTRCILLSLMNYNRDGLQFRELKTLLDISDGKLKSNLDFLEEVGYIQKIPIELDQKKMHIYLITEAGENELKIIINWIKILARLEEKEGGC